MVEKLQYEVISFSNTDTILSRCFCPQPNFVMKFYLLRTKMTNGLLIILRHKIAYYSQQKIQFEARIFVND